MRWGLGESAMCGPGLWVPLLGRTLERAWGGGLSKSLGFTRTDTGGSEGCQQEVTLRKGTSGFASDILQ